MVPVQLDITNFLSYRTTQTVDFDSIHLAGISGQNGAGKSTLLEAITWSLFGRARTRSDDDIVNRAAAKDGKRAEVQFTFELEGQAYRVVRRKKAGGRMMLEFQVQRDADNWSTLTETKSRETQAKIERTLGMNYDTFVNVSFFLQGQADEFTTKTAGQRKEILAELLGVNRWDKFKEQASEARKSAETQLTLIDHRITEADAELLEADERAANLDADTAELEKITAQLETQTLLLNQLRKAAEQAQQKKKDVAEREQRIEKERSRETAAQTALAERIAERDAYQSLLDQRAAIEAAQAEFTAVQAEFEQWQSKADQFNQTQQAMRPHELAIEGERSRLMQQQKALLEQQVRVAAMTTEREGLTTELAIRREELAGLEKSSAEITQQEAAHNSAREVLQKLRADRRLIEQEAAQLRQEATQVAKQQSEQDRLSADLAAAQSKVVSLTEQVTALGEQKTELASLQTKLNTLTTMEQPRLKAQIDKLRVRLERLENEAEGVCPVCGRELTDEHRAKVVADVKREGAPIADDYRENKRKLSAWQGNISQLDTRIKAGMRLERDLQTAQKQVANVEARSAEITRTVSAWNASGKAQKLADLTMQIGDDDALKEQEAAVSKLAEQVRGKASVEQQLQAVRKKLAEMDARSAEIDRSVVEWADAGSTQLDITNRQLEEEEFEHAARVALAELKTVLEGIQYEAEPHQAARKQRDALSDAATKFNELKSAEAALKPLNASIGDLEKQLVQYDESLLELNQQLEDARAQMAAFEMDSADLRSVEGQVTTLRNQENEANRKVGFAQQRVNVLDDLRVKRKTQLAERADITERIGQLKQLEKACGRDGIQALLIERSLPEIEDSANELLDRLTDGTMRVTFETQRQLKTSDSLRETLDIHIMDSSGTRPYENYSGGEKFRINFAIRLALSQILSKRSGARLQTLVIDEGFGSQDPRGRQRLVEAIKAIEDDFSVILVITHVEELRDAFGTRIEVTKNAAGSTVQIN